jgi:hypothetical protein
MYSASSADLQIPVSGCLSFMRSSCAHHVLIMCSLRSLCHLTNVRTVQRYDKLDV